MMRTDRIGDLNDQTMIGVPRCFAIDHEERDLPCGEFSFEKQHLRYYHMTRAECLEWLSDADHYSDCVGNGWDIGPQAIGLQSSARATAKRMIKALAFTWDMATPQ